MRGKTFCQTLKVWPLHMVYWDEKLVKKTSSSFHWFDRYTWCIETVASQQLFPKPQYLVWPLHMVYWDHNSQCSLIDRFASSLTVTHGVLRPSKKQRSDLQEKSLFDRYTWCIETQTATGVSTVSLTTSLTVTHGVLRLEDKKEQVSSFDHNVWPLHMVYWDSRCGYNYNYQLMIVWPLHMVYWD